MTIAIIPARGGSKGIPGKNITDFCGKPLLAWSIEQALAVPAIKGVYVTTDDNAIAQAAQNAGAGVIRRPPELATDTATSESALLHALDELEKQGLRPQTLVFLQATSPLREPRDIQNALDLLENEKADSVFSGAQLHDFCIWEKQNGKLESFNYDFRNRKRRQDFVPQWVENGSIYVCRTELLKKEKNRLGGTIACSDMEFWKSFEIDDAESLQLCKTLFAAYGLNRTILSPL